MVKGITMLDNVCSSDEEFTTIVVEKGGKSLITQLQQLHGSEDELQAAAQSALLSIDAMQKTKEQAGSKVNPNPNRTLALFRALLYCMHGRSYVVLS